VQEYFEAKRKKSERFSLAAKGGKKVSGEKKKKTWRDPGQKEGGRFKKKVYLNPKRHTEGGKGGGFPYPGRWGRGRLF